jgi:hypothetical protein
MEAREALLARVSAADGATDGLEFGVEGLKSVSVPQVING